MTAIEFSPQEILLLLLLLPSEYLGYQRYSNRIHGIVHGIGEFYRMLVKSIALLGSYNDERD